MLSKTWKIEQQEADVIARLCEALDIEPLIAKLLYNRGFCEAVGAGKFLRKETGVFHDPFLMRDMDRAVDRIHLALQREERITVYGDYDADGVTATTVLFLYLRSCGADVRYYIPGRFGEGYGLNTDAIEKIAADGTNLMITVDTGVTAIDEVEAVKAYGMDIVITDHHTCRPTLPDAAAVINPHRPDDAYPFKELAGVGVAFKLVCALETAGMTEAFQKKEATRRLCMEFAEYAAIGTVADVMPLRDENRLIVNIGLALLQQSQKPGILALMDAACMQNGAEKPKYPKKRKVTSSFISFTIAPRINAIGRIYSASRAVELFLTDSPEHANRLANELCDANRERQETENRIACEAFEQAEREHDLSREHILVLAGEGWHHGVIGIVASRVTEKYHLPCILFSYEAEDGAPAPTDEGKGSGRSVDGFCMIDALVECQDLLVRFGGHAQAAGMTVKREDLPEFRRRMEECAARAFSEGVPPPTLTVDCETDFSDITLRTAEALYQLEPYGCANPQPLFCLYRVKIENISALSLGKHTKLMISDPENDAVTRCAMVFGVRTEQFPYRTGDIVDLVYSMDINEFRGERSVQMLVQDIRPHTPGNTFCDRQMAVYDQCMRGIPAVTEDCAFPQDMIPTREDCKAVWLLLRTQTDAGAKDAAVTYNQLSFHTGLSVCKVRMICDTLEETTLIRRSRSAEGGFTCTLDTTGKKIDLTRAPLLMRLCEMYR